MVMSESLEDLKAIIDNAPKRGTATHIDFDGEYILEGEEFDCYFSVRHGKWLELEIPITMRSLSDIERIIELMEGK